MSVTYHEPVAYLSESKAVVFFSKGSDNAGVFKQQQPLQGTQPALRKTRNGIGVAYWGEDNRFPQNISNQMDYCGIGKSALDWKARALYGAGIRPGKITGYDPKTKEEIFTPLDRVEYKLIYDFIENQAFKRYFLEHSVDWVWFWNCFSEAIFSADGTQITGLVHQESCDCRFAQMDDDGKLKTVLISKIWGTAASQFARFDPRKTVPGLIENQIYFYEIDEKFIKSVDCVDMYDGVNSLVEIGKRKAALSLEAYKSCIIPCNYPSVNKTYYQVAAWDGARLGGWVEIASKIPEMLKVMYQQAFTIKYHIEISEAYFHRIFTLEGWTKKTPEEKKLEHTNVLKTMDDFLSGAENAYKTFISFYDWDKVRGVEYGHLKITVIENKSTIDKDLLISNNAGLQLLVAMQVHPSLFSGGLTGSGGQGAGSGSDIREAFLVYNALLKLERDVMLEPLYLVRDYNRIVGGISQWEDDIQFRIMDTVLTTLDQGTGTEKKLS